MKIKHGKLITEEGKIFHKDVNGKFVDGILTFTETNEESCSNLLIEVESYGDNLKLLSLVVDDKIVVQNLIMRSIAFNGNLEYTLEVSVAEDTCKQS